MEPRYFDLGDILSVTTGRLLSSRGMDGLHDIIGFLVGGDVGSCSIVTLAKPCKDYLMTCFPQLDAGHVQFDIARLGRCADSIDSDKELNRLVDSWLVSMRGKLGDGFMVSPIPSKEQ